MAVALCKISHKFSSQILLQLLLILISFYRVAGNEIINPAQSARMVTSDSFSFTYGTIEVRAKMPKGDWLWPGMNQLIL